MDELNAADALREPGCILDADCRSTAFVRLEAGGVKNLTVADQHDAIAAYSLNETVPLSVRVHFETAKNLYLYSWFVFRFYPVAEQQALASLEFALRERLKDGYAEASKGKKKPGLSELLKRAKSHGLIRNETLPGRVRWATERARRRHSDERIMSMVESGLTEMTYEESNVTPTADDLAYDWISNFIEVLPKMRNHYAHGSKTLHRTVLQTFEIVCDLINQLFLEEAESVKQC